jgi:outer membrane lipoprotein carrier protein
MSQPFGNVGCVEEFRHPEVEDLDAVLSVLRSTVHDIRGFEVAMDHPSAMGAPQTLRHLHGDGYGAKWRDRRFFVDHVAERPALNVLHHQEEKTIVGLTVIVDSHNVWIGQTSQYGRFSTKTFYEAGLGLGVNAKNLHRNAAIYSQVRATKNVPHRPAGQVTVDAIPLKKNATEQTWSFFGGPFWVPILLTSVDHRRVLRRTDHLFARKIARSAQTYASRRANAGRIAMTLLCVTVITLFATTPATEAEPMVRKVQTYYDAAKDFVAEFQQTYTRAALSRASRSAGRVSIVKPGMMRWEYVEPTSKLFVADGERLFIYEPEEEQVFVDEHFQAARFRSSLSFLWGAGKLSDSFSVQALEKDPKRPEVRKLILTPKSDEAYRRLTLVVNADTGQVLESIIEETSGNTNHFVFSNARINSQPPRALFAFTPPPGVEVVRR